MCEHERVRAGMALSIALLAFFFGRVGEAGADGASRAAPGSALVGVWLLDLDASDSVGPLMELMEAPWIARRLADSMTPTVTISLLDGGGIRMLNENPISTRDQELPTDGVAREREDPLGRKVVASQIWNEAGQLVISQKNYLDDERFVVIESTWTREGDRLELTNIAETKKGPLRIRRIFRPKR